MYCWLNGRPDDDIETLFEIHGPSSTDFDSFLSVFHEYLPTTHKNIERYKQNSVKLH